MRVSLREWNEPGRVAFAELRRTSPGPEGRRWEEAVAPKARGPRIRPSSPSEERGERAEQEPSAGAERGSAKRRAERRGGARH
ncbi:MAG: hypothetical protein ACRD3V_29420 [Vicinamibacteria bacterium]